MQLPLLKIIGTVHNRIIPAALTKQVAVGRVRLSGSRFERKMIQEETEKEDEGGWEDGVRDKGSAGLEARDAYLL